MYLHCCQHQDLNPVPPVSEVIISIINDFISVTLPPFLTVKLFSPPLPQAAVDNMEQYISLPAQRLAHLVQKYVHHCHMKQIEGQYNCNFELNSSMLDTNNCLVPNGETSPKLEKPSFLCDCSGWE